MSNYAAHTMACIDLALPGSPVTTLGLKVTDAHVNAQDQAFVFLGGPGTITPGPVIRNILYTLHQYTNSGTVWYINQIEFRDLSDRVNHTFAVYAKIPASMESSMTLNSWIYIVGETIYLSSVGSVGSGAGTGRTVATLVSIWRLDGIDGSGFGIFTLIGTKTATPTTPYLNQGPDNSYAPGFLQNTGYGIQGIGLQTYGEFDGVVTTTPVTYADYYGTHTFKSRETISCTYALTPYYWDGSKFDSFKITTNLSAYYRVGGANRYVLDPVPPSSIYFMSQRSSAKFLDSLGNELDFQDNFTGGFDILDLSWQSPSQSIGNGRILGGQHTLCHLVSYNPHNEFALLYSDATIYTNWRFQPPSSPPGGGGTAITSRFIIDNTQASLPYSGTIANGYDSLQGVWANCKVIIMAVAFTTNQYTVYSNFYVCKASDTTYANKYSIFSYVNGDGTITHIEGAEAVTPSLWIDNVKIKDFN